MTDATESNPTRLAVLYAIRDWFRDRRGCPTYQQLADRVGVASVSTVKGHVDSLAADDLIRLSPRRKHGRIEAVYVADSETFEPTTRELSIGELCPKPKRGAK